MNAVGIRELKSHASDLVRRVREHGEVIDITYYGEVVARLVPVRPMVPTATEQQVLWADLDQLAAEISAKWPDEMGVPEAVQAERREP